MAGSYNLTLRLDAELYEEVKVIAAQRDTSISTLVLDKLTELVEESGYAQARARALALLEQGFALGPEGKTIWSRDKQHERSPLPTYEILLAVNSSP